MNPLAFFPPPARTLSRQGNPPSSSSSSHSSSNPRPRTPSVSQSLLKNNHLTSLTSVKDSNSTYSTEVSPSTSPNLSRTNTNNGSTYNPNDPDALPPQPGHHIKRDKSQRSATNSATTKSSSKGKEKEKEKVSASITPAEQRLNPNSGSTTPDLSNSISSLNGNQSSNMVVQTSNSSNSTLPLESPSPPTSNATLTSTSRGSKLPPGMTFDLVRANEINAAYVIERNSYPPEDAASFEKLKYRQTNAPHLFLGAYLAQAPTKVAGPLTVSAFSSAPRKLIGFICATASPALTLRSMSVHSAEEGTPLVCIHSVVVSKEWRHRGIASTLLKEFHRRIKNAEESGRGGGGDRPKSSSGTGTPGSSNSSSQNLSSMNSNSGNPITSLLSNRNKEKSKTDIARGYEAFALLAHEELTGLYLKNGFRILGHSHIQYGSGGWLEMRKDIIEKDKDEEKLRLESLEESRRKDREDDKLRMEESKKEREKEREEKRKASSLLLETKNKGSGNESDGNVSDHQILKGDNEMMTSPIALNSGLPSSASSPNKNSNPNNSGFPAGINQESILAALRSTSLSNRKNSGAANPSQPYTQVLGATLAAKTPAEDSFAALEARLVNQKLGTNLAELYCPMEDCGSILLKKGSSNWTLCEAGPLLDPKLSLPEKKYPKPPSGPLSNPVPAASSIDKAPRANISTQDLSGAGPLRGFWSVNSPMSFENVGFSKDQEWIPPWVKDATSVENGGAGDLPNNQESISNPSSGNEKEKDLDGKPKREKPTRKGTWRERVRERSFTGNFLSSSESESSPSSKEKEPTIEDEKVYNEPPTLSLPKSDRDPLIVKFITCGECDCGPLGFTFLHKSQANGGLADQVSREIDGVNNAGGNRDRAVGQQELLVAADRVRYRFLKN